MRFVTSAARDAQHGWRILWRSPGYAAVVILTIALGIGANVTIFSVTPLDSVTIASVVVLVTTVAVAAISQPAWRATRIDPATALRGD